MRGTRSSAWGLPGHPGQRRSFQQDSWWLDDLVAHSNESQAARHCHNHEPQKTFLGAYSYGRCGFLRWVYSGRRRFLSDGSTLPCSRARPYQGEFLECFHHRYLHHRSACYFRQQRPGTVAYWGHPSSGHLDRWMGRRSFYYQTRGRTDPDYIDCGTRCHSNTTHLVISYSSGGHLARSRSQPPTECHSMYLRSATCIRDWLLWKLGYSDPSYRPDCGGRYPLRDSSQQ